MARALCVGEIRAKCQKTELWQNTKTQRNKYFCDVRSKCQKSKWRITGEVKAEGQIFLPKAQNWMFWWNLFLFAIFTSRTFIFKSIFQWWYRRLPSNEIVSYKSGQITHDGSLVPWRQFPRQICQIVWFRSNDFPSTLQPVSTSKWEFSPLVTLSSQEITLTIILTFCTFLS